MMRRSALVCVLVTSLLGSVTAADPRWAVSRTQPKHPVLPLPASALHRLDGHAFPATLWN